jgi:methyl-accepting chemotaxis protein
MNTWTISKRVIANNLTLISVLLIASIMSLFSLHKIETMATDRLRNDTFPGLVHISNFSDALLRGHARLLKATSMRDIAVRKADLDTAKTHFASALSELKPYEDSITSTVDRENLASLKQLLSAYDTTRTELSQLIEAGKIDEAANFISTKIENDWVPLRNQFVKMQGWNQTEASKAVDYLINQSHSAFRLLEIVTGIGILLSIYLAWLLVTRLKRVLSRVSETLGDAAEQVASAAAQVSSSSQSLAEGASQQAASVEETSSSLEETSSMTKRNSDNALKANDLARQTRASAEQGANDMQAMSTAMHSIKTSSDEVGKIIKTIDEIAFQTNILALNAAVEAARAGEAGMGFAVVAEEVRNLAQRSAIAAKETSAKIAGAIANTAQGVQISEKVSNALTDIVAKVRQVDDIISEVASASKEQTAGIDQINSAVGQMDKVTQNNAANAEESAAAAEELNAQALTMKEAVNELERLVWGDNSQTTRRHEPARPLAATSQHTPKQRGTAGTQPKLSAPLSTYTTTHSTPSKDIPTEFE